MKLPWRCPQCDAPINEHGKGECIDEDKACIGFQCTCGRHTGVLKKISVSNICPKALCTHCGWDGVYPNIATISRIEEFALALQKLRKGEKGEGKKLRIIMHEWLEECFDVLLAYPNDSVINTAFSHVVVAAILSFIYEYRNYKKS